ncbi:MAG: DEAD/DEAH box helicase [Candidatus Saccharimonadales bacterium]
MNNNSFSRRPNSRPAGGRNNTRFKRRQTPEDKLFATMNQVEGGGESRRSPKPQISAGNTTYRRNSRFERRTSSPQRRSNNRPLKRKGGGQYIAPERYINRAAIGEQDKPYEPTHVFTDFPLNPRLQSNIAAKGYQAPSAIQDQTIPHILEGRDVIGLANTGTGKTAAFVIPVIQKLLADEQRLSVLVITPTRELASQIDDEFRAFADGMRLYSTVVVGGMNIRRQINDLRRRPHVIIATPGRLKDLLQQNALTLDHIHTLVLDEADRMCDMGFLPDIKRIISLLPRVRQSLCFSATITPAIEAIINEMLHDPVTVSVRTRETSDHVEQDVIYARDKTHKIELLTSMLSEQQFDRVLVFSKTKYGAQRLAHTLSQSGHSAEAIHGNKTQPQRQRALDTFKSGRAKVLVATDVAARGLDIPNVSHVINFDQPMTYEDYVHRIGRTGRGGAKGTAYTFVEPNE